MQTTYISSTFAPLLGQLCRISHLGGGGTQLAPETFLMRNPWLLRRDQEWYHNYLLSLQILKVLLFWQKSESKAEYKSV